MSDTKPQSLSVVYQLKDPDSEAAQNLIKDVKAKMFVNPEAQDGVMVSSVGFRDASKVLNLVETALREVYDPENLKYAIENIMRASPEEISTITGFEEDGEFIVNASEVKHMTP